MRSLKFKDGQKKLRELADCSEKLIKLSKRYARIRHKTKRQWCEFRCYQACIEFTRRVTDILKRIKFQEAQSPKALIETLRNAVRCHKASTILLKINWRIKANRKNRRVAQGLRRC